MWGVIQAKASKPVKKMIIFRATLILLFFVGERIRKESWPKGPVFQVK
jgi:hypothetical protein